MDVATHKVLLCCKGTADDGKEQDVEISWDRATRVTAPGRGLIPVQQLLVRQTVDAECISERDGRWMARAIKILKPAETL